MIFEFYAAASGAWEAEKRQAQEEANRKRSEAVATRERTMEGTFATSGASFEAPLDKPEPKKQKSRDNKTSTKKAKAAGVSHATAERAHAIIENRPDLALKVKAGDISLNEATREMKRTEIKDRLEKIAAREVVEPTGEYDVLVIDPPWPMGNVT